MILCQIKTGTAARSDCFISKDSAADFLLLFSFLLCSTYVLVLPFWSYLSHIPSALEVKYLILVRCGSFSLCLFWRRFVCIMESFAVVGFSFGFNHVCDACCRRQVGEIHLAHGAKSGTFVMLQSSWDSSVYSTVLDHPCTEGLACYLGSCGGVFPGGSPGRIWFRHHTTLQQCMGLPKVKGSMGSHTTCCSFRSCCLAGNTKIQGIRQSCDQLLKTVILPLEPSPNWYNMHLCLVPSVHRSHQGRLSLIHIPALSCNCTSSGISAGLIQCI